MNKTLVEKLDRALADSIKADIFGVVMEVVSPKHDFTWTGAAGDLQKDSKYFIASITKIYTSAVVFRLADLGQLKIDDLLTQHLAAALVEGIHVNGGIDHSKDLTIRHLLAHTSGLPDYFQQRRADGTSLEKSLTSGRDEGWSFGQALEMARALPAKFAPGVRGKAFYSDTNYQLLGKIIETVSGKTLARAYDEYIFTPLGLRNTYLYKDPGDTTPHTIYFKSKPLAIPKAMASFGPDGGIVSTVDESITFIRAFFEGTLFSQRHLPTENTRWSRLFFPIYASTGITCFKLPRVFSGFRPFPQFWGHSGLSGAVAFYVPSKDVYVAGTVNQLARPDASFKLIMKLLNQIS